MTAIDARVSYAERAVKVLATAFAVTPPTFRLHPQYPIRCSYAATFDANDRRLGGKGGPTITLYSSRPDLDYEMAHEFQHYLDHLNGVQVPCTHHGAAFEQRARATLQVLRTQWAA